MARTATHSVRFSVSDYCTCRPLVGRILAVGVVFSLWISGSWGCEKRAAEHEVLTIAAGIAPLVWVAQGLVPDGAEVRLLIPLGISPHGYEAPPSSVRALLEADVVLLACGGVDAPLETILKSRPEHAGRLVCFNEHAPEAEEHHEEGHADNPHGWLDPLAMIGFIERTHDVLLSRLRTEASWNAQDEALLARRKEALLDEARAIHALYEQRLSAYRGASLGAMHDAWEPLARRYGLRIEATIVHTGELETTPGSIDRVVQAIVSGQIGVLIVEPQFDEQVARQLQARTSVTLVSMDPLGGGDWPAMMRSNFDALMAALEASGTGGDSAR